MKTIQEQINERILVLDGAMGTMMTISAETASMMCPAC